MKKKAMIVLTLLLGTVMWGMLLFDQPVKVMQPDGEMVDLYASGDEYYNYLHDKDGYTVVQDSESGYYVYARSVRGEPAASGLVVESSDPVAAGLVRDLRISKAEYLRRKALFDVPERYQNRAPNEGILNNLVVYIRFADQTEFPEARSIFDPLFNADDGETPSMKSYYREVSYEALTISSSHYPLTDMESNLSYQASEPRGYYSPYNAITNPEGYEGWEERAYREQTLLAEAIDFIASEVPDTLDIDGDDDGYVDNVCFIIRGGNDGWAELLWAHRWSLYMVDAYINGLQVMDFTFQPRTQVEVTTLNHEMFHALGAPDLYHYSSNVYSPAAQWDIMEGGSGHMSAYMKYRYGGWIEELPLISESGTYSLSPLTAADNNVLRINSPNCSSEYFVLEYRKREAGTYEMNVPTEGLLIWRVDDSLSGVGNADGPPDELYVYRPGGTSTSNGNPDIATFNADYGRTEFNDSSNPQAWLQNGGLGGIYIHQVSSASEEISFVLNPEEGFVAGTLSSNHSGIDLSAGIVLVNGQELPVDEAGGFSGMVYAGVYEAEAYLPGHGRVTEELIIEGGLLTEIDFEMDWLIPVENLDYELESNELSMSWEFTNYADPAFERFNVWLRLGEYGEFQQINYTQETFYEVVLAEGIEYNFFITALYSTGESICSDTLSVTVTTAEEEQTVPAVKQYIKNYPNPFNPSTQISYALETEGEGAELRIYNLKGQYIKGFALSDRTGRINWQGVDQQGKSVSSGIYFAVIKTESIKLQTRMMLLK